MQKLQYNQLYEIKCDGSVDKFDLFFSAYNLRIMVNGFSFSIGRFSTDILSRLKFLLPEAPRFELSIGSFCECGDATIVIGGEHHNNLFFNYTFSSGHIFKKFVAPERQSLVDCKVPEQLIIGNNVVISDNVIVLSNSKIGNGCVVGASSVVKSNLLDYGVYAGVPVKHLNSRFPQSKIEMLNELKWWNVCNHEVPRLPDYLYRLYHEQISSLEFRQAFDFQQEKTELALECDFDKNNKLRMKGILGYYVNGEKLTNLSQLKALEAYFGQISNDKLVKKWIPDIFDFVLNN